VRGRQSAGEAAAETGDQESPRSEPDAQNPIALITECENSASFVASAAVSIAIGWSEPVPGRKLHPLKSRAFHRHCYVPIGIAPTPRPSLTGLYREGKIVDPLPIQAAVSVLGGGRGRGSVCSIAGSCASAAPDKKPSPKQMPAPGYANRIRHFGARKLPPSKWASLKNLVRAFKSAGVNSTVEKEIL
jgi:hypothetical protein